MPLTYTFPVLPSSCLLCGISNRTSSFIVDRPVLQISDFLVVRSESGEFYGTGLSLRRRLNAGGVIHVVNNAPSPTSSIAASTSTIEIPVTCYQLIGVSDQAEKDEVVKSVLNLKKADAEEGYTMEAAIARQDLLMDVRDKLLFEPEYAGNVKENIAPKSPLTIPWAWLPGALCLLQEVGEEKLVLDIGRAALRHLDSKSYIHDIFLSMAFAECAIAKAAFEANKVSLGFEALARAQSFLKSKVTLGKLALLTQIEESLEELAPPCTLDLLGLPRSPENAERRRGAIAALRELLRQGLSVESSCQIQDWPCFLIQAISRLLATEIVDLLPWDNLAITRKNKKSLKSHNQRVVIDFNCFYMVLVAHIAVGFSGKQNDMINKAKTICECLIASEGVDLKFEEAFCSFLLKQGSEAEALEKLKQLESNSDSAVRNSILGKESKSTSATPSLEVWLTESVLANFPDTRACSPSLTNFFRDEKKYPENKKMGSPSIINRKMNQRPLSTMQFVNSSQHLYTAVEQLTSTDLQNPVVSAKNTDESNASMPSVQLKRNLGLRENKIWDRWLSESSLIKRVSIVALLGCTVFFSLKLAGIRSGRLQSLPIWVSAKPHSESDSFLTDSCNFRRNLASVNRNGIMCNIKVLMDMFKMHHGKHPDALYLKSSGLSATSLSHSASEVHKRSMATEDAEELVRQWENIKAEALGPTHQVHSLYEVLDESMLVQWETLAQTAKAKSCYWRFVLLHLEILQAHIFQDVIAGETAEIEALLEEAAELVDVSQPKNSKYYNTYKIRYTLKKQEDGSWKFCQSDIQTSCERRNPTVNQRKMVETELSYEQIRLNRVKENKKRMEELNLNKLAQSLRVSSSPKPSPAKPRTMRTPVDLLEVRRSSRAKGPPPNYKEMGLEPLGKPRRSYQRRDLLNRVYASEEARVHAIDRAEKLQSSLDPEFPSFIKPMLQSHVTGGFWLGLPLHFCKAHLPKRDEMMTLIDEEDDEFVAKYLVEKNGLSGGWRGFAIDHQLVDGDAVVFHLITSTMFKVYIIRVNDDTNNDSDGNEEDKENDNESNKKQEENVSEVRQLRSSGKRKRRGRK